MSFLAFVICLKTGTSGAGASHEIWNKISNQPDDGDHQKKDASKEPNLLMQQADEKARTIFDLAKTY